MLFNGYNLREGATYDVVLKSADHLLSEGWSQLSHTENSYEYELRDGRIYNISDELSSVLGQKVRVQVPTEEEVASLGIPYLKLATNPNQYMIIQELVDDLIFPPVVEEPKKRDLTKEDFILYCGSSLKVKIKNMDWFIDEYSISTDSPSVPASVIRSHVYSSIFEYAGMIIDVRIHENYISTPEEYLFNFKDVEEIIMPEINNHLVNENNLVQNDVYYNVSLWSPEELNSRFQRIDGRAYTLLDDNETAISIWDGPYHDTTINCIRECSGNQEVTVKYIGFLQNKHIFMLYTNNNQYSIQNSIQIGAIKKFHTYLGPGSKKNSKRKKKKKRKIKKDIYKTFGYDKDICFKADGRVQMGPNMLEKSEAIDLLKTLAVHYKWLDKSQVS